MDDDAEFTPIPPVRARPIDFVVALCILLNDLAEAADRFTDMLVGITARHANYTRDQVKFADAIRADLESLPTQET